VTFLKLQWLPWILAGGGLFVLTVLWRERRFFRWVGAHWFLRRSPWHVAGTAAWLLGLGLLATVLLDPREGEIRIKGKVRQDRTIILIDTSTSMLAEDVKPSRLEKSVLLAKHFVRQAVGHQVAVMVFADITKKLVPFTADLDLLDARIDSVRGLRNLNAGSSIGLAIEEAVKHFDPNDDGVAGNILVLTDGEDNEGTEKFKVPEGVSLALVGVGTRAGAPIPMKDSLGFHHGFKKERAVTVTTRLNENFFKGAVEGNPRARYFLAQSYDLPTDSVLAFFNERKAAEKEGDNLVRPVALEAWAVPGLVLVGTGVLLRMLRPFILALLLVIPLGASAQETPEPPTTPETQALVERLRQGDLDREETLHLADRLAAEKNYPMAQALYGDSLGTSLDPAVSVFNWASSELASGATAAGLARFDRLENHLQANDPESPLLPKIRENIRRAMLRAAEKKKKKNDKKDDKKNESKQGEGEPKPQEGQSGEKGQQQKPGKSQGEQQGNKNPFDPKNKDDGAPTPGEEKGDDRADKEKKDGADGDKPEEPRGRRGVKLSPLLEQLKQDDRKLQLKFLDTSTQKRRPGRRKDW
jgi:Ca-activated chloride channel family protein